MNQRWGFYLMTVACLGILASIFAGRGQTVLAVGFGVLALGYLARGIVRQIQENRDHREALGVHMSGEKTSSEKQQIVDNLLTTRKMLKGKRRSEIILGLIVVIGIVYVYPSNGLLALAMCVVFIPLGYFIIKQTRSIALIENGLASRGYSLQPTR